MEVETFSSASESETIAIAEQLAANLQRGDVVALEGDLGAGKTEFVKGVCQYFNVEDIVTSPTFTIINLYDGITTEGDPLKIYHVDLYRIDSPEELASVGFDDMVFAHDAVKLIEWPDKAAHLMPERRWTVTIASDADDDEKRTISISPPSPAM